MKIYTPQSLPSQSTTGEGAPPAPETTPPVSQAPSATAQAEGLTVMPAAQSKEYRQIAEAAQWVPAPKPPTLLEILPAEYETTRPPLLYRLSTVSEPGRPQGRIAESRTYRAKAFSCGMYYKAISRVLGDWEDK
jgi:hypothetical protein